MDDIDVLMVGIDAGLCLLYIGFAFVMWIGVDVLLCVLLRRVLLRSLHCLLIVCFALFCFEMLLLLLYGVYV